MVNKKGIGHILFFVILMFVFYLAFYQINSIIAFIFLLLLPVGWGFYHFVKSIMFFVSKEYRLAFQSLVSTLLLLCIPIKLTFVFYNVLLYSLIMVVGIILVVRKTSNSNSWPRTVLFCLIVLNLIVVFVPNKTTFLLLRSGYISWGNNLKWDDFKGIPDPEINHDVQEVSGFEWYSNGVFNYPTVVTYTFVDPERSWKKNSCCDNPDAVLNHEQGHFDISEIYRRMAVDSANSTWPSSYSKVENIMEYFYQKCEEKQKHYDSKTQHGTDSIMQMRWDEYIKDKLENYK